MSNPLNRTYSLRKRIRPMADIEEEDENERRDSSGRKRVEVVDCLLDSSADELDNDIINVEMPTNILWLTFNEICHIRYVLVQTSLTTDKQYSDLRNGRLCFRCRKSLNLFFFLPSFLRFNNYEICFICKQMICKKCSYYSFIPPASKLTIPMRIQSLIKSSSVTLNDKKDKITKTNAQSRTVCLDCLQVFNEHLNIPQRDIKPLVSPFRRTGSLPPLSSKTSTEIRYTRHRRRPIQAKNNKIEKTALITTSKLTDL